MCSEKVLYVIYTYIYGTYIPQIYFTLPIYHMNEKVNAYPVIECAPKFKGGTKRGALLESRLHSQNRGCLQASKS